VSKQVVLPAESAPETVPPFRRRCGVALVPSRAAGWQVGRRCRRGRDRSLMARSADMLARRLLRAVEAGFVGENYGLDPVAKAELHKDASHGS
jgi:hypothetical protein